MCLERSQRREEERRGTRLVFGLQTLKALLSLGVQTCQALLKHSLGVSRYKCAKRFNALHVRGDVVVFLALGLFPPKEC